MLYFEWSSKILSFSLKGQIEGFYWKFASPAPPGGTIWKSVLHKLSLKHPQLTAESFIPIDETVQKLWIFRCCEN